ncbi:MerR family transcriptional regulator [Winogradskyella sp. A3E31]|uniref:MerR family transcriptional regulator n=1 Tax=Winogradskyella sp. A3E31 TaxID=3349637 RepID=UPI00398B3EED
MNNIKNEFSIKDLENLTGIKAHTIRIWEKRYNLLSPKRTDTNIRYYDLGDFQKLMNVSYLNNNGYKISKIATLDDKHIPSLANEIAQKDQTENHAINAFKLAMINFDQHLLYKTYDSLLKEKTFKGIFYDIFIPLLNEIGLLWQTTTITPAHEHFLVAFIKQKILLNIELIQSKQSQCSEETYVLYLPDNEIHEIGLLFINYEIVSNNHRCISLGASVPMDNLSEILKYHEDVTFISYFTVKPEKEKIKKYLLDFNNTLLKSTKSKLWVLGKMLEHIDTKSLPNKIEAFTSIKEVVKKL